MKDEGQSPKIKDCPSDLRTVGAYDNLASLAIHLLNVFVWLSRVCIMAEGQDPPLKKKILCQLNQNRLKNLVGLERVIKVASSKFLNTAVTWSFCNADDEYARCTLCLSDFSISHGGQNNVTTHTTSKPHRVHS